MKIPKVLKKNMNHPLNRDKYGHQPTLVTLNPASMEIRESCFFFEIQT